MKLRPHLRRWHSPSVFTLICVCFLLPFATVSVIGGCSSGPDASTSFTGVQLMTHTVPNGGKDPDCARDISVCVERAGAAAAGIAFGAAIVGLLLGLLGIERGPGWCASLGLGALGWLAWALGPGGRHDASWHAGYSLALWLFVWAGLVHARRAWIRKHPDTTTAPPPLLFSHPPLDPTNFERRT